MDNEVSQDIIVQVLSLLAHLTKKGCFRNPKLKQKSLDCNDIQGVHSWLTLSSCRIRQWTTTSKHNQLKHFITVVGAKKNKPPRRSIQIVSCYLWVKGSPSRGCKLHLVIGGFKFLNWQKTLKPLWRWTNTIYIIPIKLQSFGHDSSLSRSPLWKKNNTPQPKNNKNTPFSSLTPNYRL